MAEPALIPPLAMGALVGIAITGAVVWFYNRRLAQFVELPIKKTAALLALPSGVPIGLLAAWRLAGVEASPVERMLWWGLAVAGLAVVAWLLTVQLQKLVWARSSQYRRVVGMPQPLEWRRFPKWQRVLLWLLQPLNQVGALRIHEREVALPGLSPAFDGYRILHVSDLHAHPTLNREWYDAAIRAAMKLKPDLVLHGGDFITQPEHLPLAAEVLRPLRQARDGVFTVRGNHDLWKGPQRTARTAAATGMRLLSNEGRVVERAGHHLSIIGLEAPYVEAGPRSQSLLEAMPHPRIALVHSPDAFDLARRLGCGLALAGHTHGGQVRLPVFGATVTSCAAGPRTATGVARLGGMWCITSNGLGVFFPIRFLCPPEVLLIVLRSPDSA